MERLYAALERVPLFRNVRQEDIELELLGGALTNVCYKVTTGGAAYVLRLAGEGTSDYIDRAAEKHNAQVAAEAGVNAEVLYFDASEGTMVTRFVEGVCMNAGTGLAGTRGRRFGPRGRSSGFTVWGGFSGPASTFSPRSTVTSTSCAVGGRRCLRITTR